jgi:pimeloyl-ACP methyl ester carboxylesterase
MNFTQERPEEGGVIRRSFELTVDGQTVPCVIWSPEAAKGPRPLMLMGHGGSQHKKTAGIVARARTYARKFGYATLAIDAPGHGDRISREEAEALGREVGARVRGETSAPMDPARMRQMGQRSLKAVPEWKAALDAAQGLDFVGAGGPVGYWGVSMGTAIGVPFVAQEPRITAAVFGLAGLREGQAEFEAAAPFSTPSPRRKRPCTSTRAATWTSRTSSPATGKPSTPATSAWRPTPRRGRRSRPRSRPLRRPPRGRGGVR